MGLSAGTSSYAYDQAGRLTSDADAASGTTGSYSYNKLGQVTSIGYGTGNDTQNFGYDTLHRLTADAVNTASGATVASLGYGYDANSNLTSKTTTGLATAGGGTGTVSNTYGYDQANRLTSWISAPSGGSVTTSTYGYDSNGNLVSNNGITQTYDARNEVTSDGHGNSFTYTAAGNLSGQASPGNANYSFSSDGYGQQITDGSSSFAWDALNRVVSAGEASSASYSVALTYDGLTRNVASDPSASYSRDPAGQITGVDAAAAGRTLALVDAHSDLSGTFTAAGTSLTGSVTWDPWGQQLATTGPAVQVGYQGQWTDPVTRQVNMGSRMFRPAQGGFINADTYTGGEGGPAVTDDLHAYAGDNPMTVTDPTGHVNQIGGGGGPVVTQSQVNADKARADAAAQQAATLNHEAAQAAQAAGQAQQAANSATALARTLNSQAAQAEATAAKASAYAHQVYQYALSLQSKAENLLNKADAEQQAADNIKNQLADYYNAGDFKAAQQYAAKYGNQADALAAQAATDLSNGNIAANAYERWMGWVARYNQIADQLESQARQARQAATAATAAAGRDRASAAALTATARKLASQARAATNKAAAAEAQYRQDQQYYQQEKSYGYTDPPAKHTSTTSTGSGQLKCLPARGGSHCGGTGDGVSISPSEVLLGLGAVALTLVNVGQAGLDPVTDGAEAADVAALGEEAAAGEGAGSTAEDAAASCGESFTPGTKVLLANGTAVPISQLKPGEKVLATNTKTGRTQPETIAAVLVNHDTDLYDLRIKAGTRTAVIDTTSNHLFWVPGTGSSGGHSGRWVKAAALRNGTHLRTPTGDNATVLGGYAPEQASGWMWDLTIPGDHDFYIDTTAAPVLVHNCFNPKPPDERPPGWNDNWQWREGSRNSVPRSWWDPKGGEWRWHAPDKYHVGHWDYNPWNTWNEVWQHIYPGVSGP